MTEKTYHVGFQCKEKEYKQITDIIKGQKLKKFLIWCIENEPATLKKFYNIEKENELKELNKKIGD